MLKHLFKTLFHLKITHVFNLIYFNFEYIYFIREKLALNFEFISFRSNRIIVYNKCDKRLNTLIEKMIFFI